MGCDVGCPAISCPKSELPKFECPGLNCPNVDFPGVKCGDVKGGDLTCSTINFPGLTCEAIHCPDVNYPDFKCASLECTNLTLNCPQCIDNSIGVVIMVTIIVSLTLILVFIYKMKQSHDMNKRYLAKNRRQTVLDKPNTKKKGCFGRSSKNTNAIETDVIEDRSEEAQVQLIDLSPDPNSREFDYNTIRKKFEQPEQNIYEEI